MIYAGRVHLTKGEIRLTQGGIHKRSCGDRLFVADDEESEQANSALMKIGNLL